MHRLARVLPALALLACQGEQPDSQPASESPPAVDAERLAQARATADALGGDLMAMLTGELQRGGPQAALAVCADSAQVRTRAHEESGVMVRRVGTRVRNPANTPDSLEQAVLAAFQATLLAGGQPTDTVIMQALAGGGTRLRLLRPVRVQEGCLACHGPAEGIAPEVRAVLAERYPEDQATGYAVGELRGAVSVQVDRP